MYLRPSHQMTDINSGVTLPYYQWGQTIRYQRQILTTSVPRYFSELYLSGSSIRSTYLIGVIGTQIRLIIMNVTSVPWAMSTRFGILEHVYFFQSWSRALSEHPYGNTFAWLAEPPIFQLSTHGTALRSEVVKKEITTVLCVWTMDYVNSQIQF